jgi:threonine/homoserine/homoserine lactone efflux protein
MNSTLVVTYLIAVLVLELTPGPDMLFCLASGLKGGPRCGFLAAAGAASGEVIHISASALGLAALFRAAPLLFDIMRVLGAAYLVVLGMRALRGATDRVGGANAAGASARQAYWRGLVTDLLNPKMALFSIAFLPQFIDPHAGNVAFQFVVLGASFVVLEILVDGTVGVLAGRLTGPLRGRRARRNLNVTTGCVYLGLGAKLALQR